MQLAIAAGMLSRRTMPVSALGIAVLFVIAILQYGAFHLAGLSGIPRCRSLPRADGGAE